MGHGFEGGNHCLGNIIGRCPTHNLHDVAGTDDRQDTIDAQRGLINRPLSLYLNTDTHCAGFDLNNIEVSTQRVDERFRNRHRSPFHAATIMRFESHTKCDLRKRQVVSTTRPRRL